MIDAVPHNLPVPVLEYDFTIECDLEPRISVGQGPWGHRNWISFTGGRFTSSWANGRIRPGGQDSQVVLADMSTRVDTSYLIELDGEHKGEHLVFKTEGWRTGPKEVLQRLFDPATADNVDPTTYSFRLFVQIETGSERLKELNTAMWVGSGKRLGLKVVYNAYRVR